MSPPSSCQKIVVNDVTATVWKNTVRRGTSDKLHIALPHLLRNAAKQRNKETTKKKCLKHPVHLLKAQRIICQHDFPCSGKPNSLLDTKEYRRQTNSSF